MEGPVMKMRGRSRFALYEDINLHFWYLLIFTNCPSQRRDLISTVEHKSLLHTARMTAISV